MTSPIQDPIPGPVSTGPSRNRRLAAAATVPLLLLLLLVGRSIVDDPPEDDPPSGDPSTQCADETEFYSRLVDGNRFGPSVVQTELDEILLEHHIRRCADPAKTVADVEYQQRAYTSPEERALRTVELRDNPELRRQKVRELEAREAEAVKVEVVTMSDRYQTMYQTPSSPGEVPWIYATTADRPSFKVLKFTYSDGSWDAYKLDCGFQPVASSFPGLPTSPEAPPAQPETPGNPSTPPGETPSCPPDKPWGTPPNCFGSKNELLEATAQGNVPTQVQGPAPPVSGPASPPAAGEPPESYTAPTAPVPTTVPRTTVPQNEGQPDDDPVPPDGPTGPACDPRFCD